MLADAPQTCAAFVAPDAPLCLHSTLLRDTYRRGLRIYVSRAVWIMWLQRYLYLRRLTQAGYNTLLRSLTLAPTLALTLTLALTQP